MADTYEQNLAQKSSLTKSDYIRVVGSDNVSYKQILTAVAKTITDYELNSADSAVNLVSGDDLNNFKTAGTYRSSGSGVSAGVVNTPTTTAGYLLLVLNVSTSFTVQIAITANSPSVTYKRAYRVSNTTWGAWEQIPTRAEVDALAKGHVSFAGTAGDTPTTLIQNGLSNGNIPYNQAFVARISAGYYFWAVGHFYISSNKTYGSAIVSRPGYTCKVNCSAGTWTETAI